jgi:hypothetical protein
VSLDRNFSGQTLAHTLTDITAMFTAGLVDRALALELLQRGEVLKDGDDLDEVIDRMEQQDLADMEEAAAIADGQAPPVDPQAQQESGVAED